MLAEYSRTAALKTGTHKSTPFQRRLIMLSELDTPMRHAVLDEAHIGDVKGAFGTIKKDDAGPRNGWRRRLMTLLAILSAQA